MLSQQEFESIIEHELAHIQWGDNMINLLLSLIQGLFWFIPFKQIFLNRAAFYRELACDLATTYPDATAQALLKQGKLTQKHSSLVLTFSSKQTQLLKRTSFLLNQPPLKKSIFRTLGYLLFFIGEAVFLYASRFFPF